MIAHGADVSEFVKVVRTGKFKKYETDPSRNLRSATLQVFGELDAVITIHFKELLNTNRVGDLAITAKGQWQQELHCDLHTMKNTRIAMWNAITADLDLSQLFAVLGDFGKILPKAKISMHYQHYMAIYVEPFRLDFHIVLGVSFQLECKGLIDIINAIADIVEFVGTHVNSGPLKKEMESLKKTTNAICSGKHKLSVSLKFNDGAIDAHETYIAYNSNVLRLSSLPTCPSVNGIQPGGKCVKNSDCWSDKGSYNNGYASKHGYCKNHKTWFTTLGCFGTCVKKLRGGESCSKTAMNSPFWEHLDASNAEHAACLSGKCYCDTCAEESSKRLRNDKKCVHDSHCASGWCEGRITISCNGKCKSKRQNLATAYGDHLGYFGRSCVSNKEVCGKCAKSNKKVPNGYKCSFTEDCESGFCKPNAIGVTVSCNGRCQAKRRPGTSAWCLGPLCKGESCESNKETCGTCTNGNKKLSNGKKCSFNSHCDSDNCSGWFTPGCLGECKTKEKPIIRLPKLKKCGFWDC